MKYILLLVISFLLLMPDIMAAEKTKFLIIRKWSGGEKDEKGKSNADLFTLHLEGEIRKQFQDELPCASAYSVEDIYAVLNHEREKQLLGVGDENAVADMAGAMGASYLITLNAVILGQDVYLSVRLLDVKKAKALIMLDDKGPNNEGAFEVAGKLANKFFEEVCKLEICPYKGKIKVEVTEDLKVDITKEYPIYCNDQDRIYKMHYKETRHTDNFWAFEKVTKVSAKAYLDFNISEETEKEVDDGCYACPSGKTRRYYHETNSKTGKIDEVSSESELYGMRINDARINITFNDDGTYSIKIEAASDVGEVSETRYQNDESWCATNYGPPKTIKHKADIPLVYIFGPYKGSAKDKFLTQNPDPVEETNAISGSKTTYNISFDLERE